jgi:protein phosphatase
MGGAQAGEVASALAAATLAEGFQAGSTQGIQHEGHIVALVQAANQRVHERAATDISAQGMGTTMTVAYVQPNGGVTIAHVGDSRAYMLRDDRLHQLTDDHSLVAELVRRGELTPGEAEIHPQRSVITRALGTDANVEVDSFTVAAKAGDLFLLCSDGLTTMIGSETIRRLLAENRADLRGTVRELIRAANENGGGDNITAVVFEVVDGDDPTEENVLAAVDEDTLHGEVRLPEHLLAGGDTMVFRADELAPAEPSEPRAGAAQTALAALVVLALSAVVVALVVWGLAR